MAEYYLNEESETSQSEMESEDEVLDDPLLKNHEKVTTLKEVYDMAVESSSRGLLQLHMHVLSLLYDHNILL